MPLKLNSRSEILNTPQLDPRDAVARQNLARPLFTGPVGPGGHLDDNPGLLGEQRRVQIVPLEVDAPALLAGEGHLQQGDDQAAVADVVAGEDGSALDQVLNRLEHRLERGRILDVRRLVAQLAEDLGERARLPADACFPPGAAGACCRSA